MPRPTPRLIAAAPQTAAALKAAVTWWHGNPRNFHRLEPAWLPAARAALKAADQWPPLETTP